MPEEKGFRRLEEFLSPALDGISEDAQSGFADLLKDLYGKQLGDTG